MARPARPSDATLTELFLDMLAAERGAGKNTLAAYGRDLADFADYLAGGRTVATAATDDIRGYLGDLTKRGMQPATVTEHAGAMRPDEFATLGRKQVAVGRSGVGLRCQRE